MKKEFLERFKEVLEYGSSNFVQLQFCEGTSNFQRRVGMSEFFFKVVTGDSVLFITRDEHFHISLSEVKDEVIDTLWEELGNVPVNEDDEIDVKFLQFDAGTHREDIWHWFENTFNISVGERFCA